MGVPEPSMGVPTTVHQCSRTVHRCSRTVHRRSKTVHRRSRTVHRCSRTVHRCSRTVHGCSRTVHRCSRTVHRCSRTVHRRSRTVHWRSQKRPSVFPEPSMGVPEPSMGVPEASMGVPEASMGVPEASMGVPEPSMGVPEPSIGVPEPSIGVPHPSIPGRSHIPSSLRQAGAHHPRFLSVGRHPVEPAPYSIRGADPRVRPPRSRRMVVGAGFKPALALPGVNADNRWRTWDQSGRLTCQNTSAIIPAWKGSRTQQPQVQTRWQWKRHGTIWNRIRQIRVPIRRSGPRAGFLPQEPSPTQGRGMGALAMPKGNAGYVTRSLNSYCGAFCLTEFDAPSIISALCVCGRALTLT